MTGLARNDIDMSLDVDADEALRASMPPRVSLRPVAPTPVALAQRVTARARPATRRRRLPFVLFVLAAALAILVAGEVVARRVLGLGTPPLYRTEAQIEYMLQPDQDVSRFGNHVFVNHYGMRSDNLSLHKVAGEYRVLVLGDSVVNGGSQTDQSQLATSLLQQDLRQAGLAATVGNISAGSWGPGNWLAYTQRYGFFEADELILILSSHDYADNPTFLPLDSSTHPTRGPVFALGEGFTRYLPRFLPWLHKSPGAVTDRFEPIANEQAAQLGLQQLRDLLNSARQHVSKVTVLQHWERSEVEKGVAGPGNQRIRALATQAGVRTVSLRPWFQHAIDAGHTPYRDNIHPDALGQRLLADAILSQLSMPVK